MRPNSKLIIKENKKAHREIARSFILLRTRPILNAQKIVTMYTLRSIVNSVQPVA